MGSAARVVCAFILLAIAFAAAAGAETPRAASPPRTATEPIATAAAEPPAAAARSAPTVAACAGGMLLVDGDYCTEVRQDCLVWQDPPSNPFARCAKFAPSRCVGARVHKRFCIDRDEYTRAGEALPAADVSWTDARRACEADGKRLCRETEWELACEGEQMHPYPTGFDRDATACNVDRDHLIDAAGKLRDLRQPAAALAACVSAYGARNMVGNVDEWVVRDRTAGEWRSALKGGWWMPGRDRCRPATTAHGETFRGPQTGFRCCADERSNAVAAEGSAPAAQVAPATPPSDPM
jgi:hypothetical protein